MKKDLGGFFSKLPPEARRLVESLDRPRAQPGGQAIEKAPEQGTTRSMSFSSLEEEILGGIGVGQDIQAEDRMFDPPAAERLTPEPLKRRSMSELIESMERNKG